MKIDKNFPIQQKDANPDERIRDAAKMYEQYFLNEMTKSMRKTVAHSELNTPSMAEKIYSEQLDGKYVESWANRGGVGLADIIYNQLQDRFFNRGGPANRPSGPLPVDKGTTIKIDDSTQHGFPIVTPKSSLPTNEVSFIYQWDDENRPQHLAVNSPYDGEFIQNFRLGDDRQIIKVRHDNGLQSTLSFLGMAQNLKVGDTVTAGQKLGSLSPDALGLTWQIGQVGV